MSAPKQTGAQRSPAWRQRFRGQFTKTKMCRFYTAGHCRFEEGCPFAHKPEELSSAPDLRKTSLCDAWKRGACKLNAADCPFAHGDSDLNVTPAFVENPLSKRVRATAENRGMASPSRSETSTRSSENSPIAARTTGQRGDLVSPPCSPSSQEDGDDDDKASSEGKAPSEDCSSVRSHQRSRNTAPATSGFTGCRGVVMPGKVFPKTPGLVADVRPYFGVEETQFYMPPPFVSTFVLPATPLSHSACTWNMLLGLDTMPGAASVTWTEEGREMIANMLRQAMPDCYED